jgi:hypothetical protein
MNNVSQQFNEQYMPVKALLIYQSVEQESDSYEPKSAEIYVESYDVGKQGNPINAHPLSLNEMIALGELLQSTQEMQNNYLQSKSVIPPNLIYVNTQSNGYAVWFTPPKEVDLYFNNGLEIPSGKAKLPAILWKATRERLQIFALKGKGKPNADTSLFYAPLFNLS